MTKDDTQHNADGVGLWAGCGGIVIPMPPLFPRTTWCAVLLRVEQPVSPCCLLQTLCQAGNQSHNISAVAHTLKRIGDDPLLLNEAQHSRPRAATISRFSD